MNQREFTEVYSIVSNEIYFDEESTEYKIIVENDECNVDTISFDHEYTHSIYVGQEESKIILYKTETKNTKIFLSNKSTLDRKIYLTSEIKTVILNNKTE
jgi:hypothetical protein